MTNTEQTLDRLRHLGPGGRLRASRRSGLGRVFPPPSTIAFRHGAFSDETEEGRVAYVWGQVMVQLKRYVETGVAGPVFVHS